jgi:hypothetical protein
MKTKLLMLCCIFRVFPIVAEINPKPKDLKNTISLGISNINFFDNTTASWSTESRKYYGLIGSFNLSYNRKINENYLLSLNLTPFCQNAYVSEVNSNNYKGTVLSRAFGIASVDFGKNFRTAKIRNFVLESDNCFKFLYRFGTGDEIFLGRYPGSFETVSEEVNFLGMGLGVATNFHITYSKCLIFSLELSYSHVFENGKYEEFSPPFAEYYKYTPPRNMLILQPKIGFIF